MEAAAASLDFDMAPASSVTASEAIDSFSPQPPPEAEAEAEAQAEAKEEELKSESWDPQAEESDDDDDDDDDGWSVDDDAFEDVDADADADADAADGQAAAPPPPPPPPPDDSVASGAATGAVHTPEKSRPVTGASSMEEAAAAAGQFTPPVPSGAHNTGHHGSLNSIHSRTESVHSAQSASVTGTPGHGSSIFFADATLDLEEAHDLAETPVPNHQRRVVFAGEDHGQGGGGGDGGGDGNNTGGVGVGGGGGGGTKLDAKLMPNMPPLNHDEEKVGTRSAAAAAAGRGGIGSEAADIINDDNDRKLPAKPTVISSETSALGPSKNGNGRFEVDTPAALPRPVGPAGSNALNRPMASASSAPTSQPSLQPTYRPRRPNRPRDLRWATAALTFIPTSLTLPYLLSRSLMRSSDDDGTATATNWEAAAQSAQGHTATFLSTTIAFASTFVIGRLLYRTAGGGDGDDDRHRAADLIVGAAPISLAVLPILALVIYLATPSAWPFALLPLFFFCKDIVALRAGMAAPDIALPSDRRRGGGMGRVSGGGGGSSEGGRRTFFMALCGTALDILSRSLRRQSFYRFVTAAMAVQFVVVLLWKGALFKSLAVSHTVVGKALVLLALLGGKWATGLVSRMLSLVASGGVTSWFAQQSILIDEMERMKDARREEEERKAEAATAAAAARGATVGVGGDASSTAANDSIDDASEDFVDGMYGASQQVKSTGDVAADASARAAARAALHSMPEAYRTADASVYSPVIDFDEGMDDDFDDEEEEGMFVGEGGGGGGRSGGAREMGARTSSWTGGGSGGRSTVKSFVVSGATVSFGSVAQCGLLGGPAQFVWSVVRNADTLGLALTRRFSSSAARFGFRGMSVSAWDEEDGGGLEMGGGAGGVDWRHGAMMLYSRFDFAAREFVRGHSDLAMSHVAAYFKSYQRAANDVAALIDASGVEPIIHDDITTRMCAAVGTAISSIVVMFIGYIVAHHRGTRDPSAPQLSDQTICEIMLLSFVFSYTIIFTIMEPLRASIKAVYVCFAQHPQSLSQAFPLIFHRLSRISEANVVV